MTIRRPDSTPSRSRLLTLSALCALGLATAPVVLAQGAQGTGMPGMDHQMGGGPPTGIGQQDDGHMADMQVFHALFDRRADIRRAITLRPDGVETLTESAVPEVAGLIKGHVASMYRRMAEGRPIHQRDPLFREVFAHRQKVRMTVEQTATGVRVIEQSDDPYVAALIQAHARVIDQFLANGMREMHTDHAVPPRPTSPGGRQ